MRKTVSSICRSVAIASMLLAGTPITAIAAERWHTAMVKAVYPLGNGGFALLFSQDSVHCSSPATPRKYYYVYSGENGVNAEGAKLIYAGALAAMVSGYEITVAFDDATSGCYVNRMVINAP